MREFWLNVYDYGVKGNGNDDDTPTLQAAINAAIHEHKATARVLIPAGNYLLKSTLYIQDVHGLIIEGVGPRSTNIMWAGQEEEPAIRMRDCRDCVLTGLSIAYSKKHGGPFMSGITIDNSNTPGSVMSTSNTIRNVLIDGLVPGGVGVGIAVAQGSAGDNNNEFHVMDKVTVYNFAEAAFTIEHSQAKKIVYRDCNCSGTIGLSEAIVSTRRGNGGSFFWYGGGGNGADSTFALGNPTDTILISGGNFEGCKHLLTTTGPTGAAWPVIIDSVRWASNAVPAEGSHVIDFRTRGPLSMRGNAIGSFGDSKPLSIRVDVSGPMAPFDYCGNALSTSLAEGMVFPGAVPSQVSSNVLWRANRAEYMTDPRLRVL